MMRRYMAALFLIAVCILLSGMEAEAADIDFYYTGPVDIFTGEPVGEGTADENDQISIPDGSAYDRTRGMFVYTIGGGTLACSVCDGMIVSGEVGFLKFGELKAIVYYNGEMLSEIPQSVISPGTYVVASNGGSHEQIMTFRIVGEAVSGLKQYVMPEGFHVRSVVFNNSDMLTDYGMVNFDQEGSYAITYRCDATSMDYSLRVVIDNTPPAVSFEGLDDRDSARGPVTVTGYASEDTVTVTRDGNEAKLNFNSQLTEVGDYRVVVTDKAGNYVEREFTILLYLNMQSWMFFGLVLIIVTGLAIVLTIERMRLRVR